MPEPNINATTTAAKVDLFIAFSPHARPFPGRLPVWLRVQRTGSLFTAFASQDGSTWKQVGPVLQINMGTEVLGGICLTAHNDGKICTALVDSVSVSPDVAILGPQHLQGSSPGMGCRTRKVTTSTGSVRMAR